MNSPALLKELRLIASGAVFAFLAPALVWVALRAGALDWSSEEHRPYFFDILGLVFIIRHAGVNLTAAASVGSEFEHRTLERLFAEPKSRTRHWGLKIAVLGLAYGVIFLSDILWIHWASMAKPPESYVVHPRADRVFETVCLDASMLLWAIFGTTTATLMTRRTYPGFIVGICLPVLFLLLPLGSWSSAEGFTLAPALRLLFLVQIVPLALLSVLGVWRIRRMEVARM